jgi:iron-sulfur cluster assembly protein
MSLPGLMTVSDKAASRIKDLLAKDTTAIALRVGVKSGGCSGLMYEVGYARERKPHEDVVEDNGVTIFIDPTVVMFLIGSEMDYQEDKFQAGFVFNNPNELDRCGCGESFRVDKEQLAELLPKTS